MNKRQRKKMTKRLLDLHTKTGEFKYHRQAILLTDPAEFARECIKGVK